MKRKIIGLVTKIPEWWAATAVLWTTVPEQNEAANEGVFLCLSK